MTRFYGETARHRTTAGHSLRTTAPVTASLVGRTETSLPTHGLTIAVCVVTLELVHPRHADHGYGHDRRREF